MPSFYDEFMEVKSLHTHSELTILKNCIKELESRIALNELELDEQYQQIKDLKIELDQYKVKHTKDYHGGTDPTTGRYSSGLGLK